jgi:hypothetical protein
VEHRDYRRLRGYKYQTLAPVSIQTPYRPDKLLTSSMFWVALNEQGWLTVRRGYCWDGPSGPSVDTDSFMRGSLFHDALYQLLREGQLRDEGTDRRIADELLRDVCRADGMSRFRAWYVYRTLRMAGGKAARRQK